MARKSAGKAAKKAARMPAAAPSRDAGEDVHLMEPMRISEENDARPELTEIVLDLSKQSASFRSGLPRGLSEPLAEFVRSMNCYYSNLIEGHNTHPVDIERALNNELSADPRKRDLQLEAKAHIEVQRWIDEGGLQGKETTIGGVRDIHRRFTNLLPDDLCWVTNPSTGEANEGRGRRDEDPRCQSRQSHRNQSGGPASLYEKLKSASRDLEILKRSCLPALRTIASSTSTRSPTAMVG